MKLIMENWQNYLEEASLLQKFGDLIRSDRLRSNYDTDASNMPFGGYTLDGKGFLVIRLPDPDGDGEISGTERQAYRKNPDIPYLVRFEDGKEGKLLPKDMKSKPGEGPSISRDAGARILAKMNKKAGGEGEQQSSPESGASQSNIEKEKE